MTDKSVDTTRPSDGFPSSSCSLADIAKDSGHIGYSWDLTKDQIIWSDNWPNLFGKNLSAAPNNTESFAAVVFSDDQALVFDTNTASFDREYRLALSDGHLIWVHEHGTTDFESGRAIRQRGLLRLIDQPRSGWPGTVSSAQGRDVLTGKPNRAAMQGQIRLLLKGPQEISLKSSLMVISIDKMAFVNEAVGTKSGDVLLCGVIDRLAELSPNKAFLARLGGDSFGILLPGIGHETIALSERILQSFRDHHITTPAAPLHVTVSIGCVRLTDSTMEASELMIHAEQALREARARGRNQYVEYVGSAERSQETRHALDIGERVKQVLKEDGLKLAYQPVVSNGDRKIVFYEALARLFEPNGDMISAADFIPIVEQQGLAVEFDHHVMNMVLEEMERAPDIHIAVNVSGITASQSDFPDYIQKLLGSRPHIAKRLIVEVTETAAIIDIAETQRFSKILCELGGRVSLDDFGAGFTSISYLRSLPLAIMKIDKGILDDLINNAEQQHLVRMLIELARGLNIETVAEGVETEEVAQWLEKENVSMMQGYYFGKPDLNKPWDK